MSQTNTNPQTMGGNIGTIDKKWGNINAKIINVDVINGAEMTGATASENGKSGTVPAPTVNEQYKFLRGDGTWQNIINTDSGDEDTPAFYIKDLEPQTHNKRTIWFDTQEGLIKYWNGSEWKPFGSAYA